MMCGLCFLYSKLWEDLSVNSYLITVGEALSYTPPTLFVSAAPQGQRRLVVKIPRSLETQVSIQNLEIFSSSLVALSTEQILEMRVFFRDMKVVSTLSFKSPAEASR